MTPSINEGEYAAVSGTIVDAAWKDSHQLTVTWGDGTTSTYDYAADTEEFEEIHRYPDNPAGDPSVRYAVGLTLSDDDGSTATAATGITVNGVPPGLGDVQIVSAVNVGEVSVLHGRIESDSTQDTYIVQVNWGDGSTPQTVDYPAGTQSFTLTHAYSQAGDFPVGVQLVDSDGVTCGGSAGAMVSQPSVSVVLTGPSWVLANTPLYYFGTVTPPSDGMTATFDFGDGSGSQTISITGDQFTLPAHVYASYGASYTISLEVNGPNGPLGSATYGVSTQDVWPSWHVATCGLVTTTPLASVGQPAELTINYTGIPEGETIPCSGAVFCASATGSPVYGVDYVCTSDTIDFIGATTQTGSSGSPPQSYDYGVEAAGGFNFPAGSGSLTFELDVLTQAAYPRAVTVSLQGWLGSWPLVTPGYGGAATIMIPGDADVVSIAPPVAEEPEDSARRCSSRFRAADRTTRRLRWTIRRAARRCRVSTILSYPGR